MSSFRIFFPGFRGKGLVLGETPLQGGEFSFFLACLEGEQGARTEGQEKVREKLASEAFILGCFYARPPVCWSAVCWVLPTVPLVPAWCPIKWMLLPFHLTYGGGPHRAQRVRTRSIRGLGVGAGT